MCLCASKILCSISSFLPVIFGTLVRRLFHPFHMKMWKKTYFSPWQSLNTAGEFILSGVQSVDFNQFFSLLSLSVFLSLHHCLMSFCLFWMWKNCSALYGFFSPIPRTPATGSSNVDEHSLWKCSTCMNYYSAIFSTFRIHCVLLLHPSCVFALEAWIFCNRCDCKPSMRICAFLSHPTVFSACVHQILLSCYHSDWQ